MHRVIPPLVGFCLVIAAMTMAISPVAAQAEPELVVTPETSNAEVGETIEYDVVLERVDRGVGAYEFTAAVSNPDVATITDVSLNGEPDLTDINYSEDGDSVDIRAALANTRESGDITLVTISVQAETPGTTDLSLSGVAVGDEEGYGYEPTVLNGEMTVLSPSEQTLAVSPSENTVDVSEDTTANVVLENAVRGVGAYNLTISVGDSSVAKITDISLAGGPEFQNVKYGKNNQSVQVRVAAADTKQTGDVVIAAVTLTGVDTGSTSIDLDKEVVGDERGYEYLINSVVDGELTVDDGSSALPSFGEGEPADLDSDGLYEDLNGDGEATVTDVQLLYTERNSDALNSNPEAVDFNQDGSFDVVDIQALFDEVTR